jgi:[ribosomal protein S5]-alanine N-acetyltransferase
VPPSLTTERLLLRQWRAADLDGFAEMMAEPSISRYLGDGQPMTRFDSWRSLMAFAGAWRLLGFAHWVLELRETGEYVGRAGPWRPDGWPALEIGWAISPRHQGRGYATEAGRAAQRVVWEAMAPDRLISLVRPGNEASMAVARKLGGQLSETIDLLGSPALVFDYPKPTSAGGA